MCASTIHVARRTQLALRCADVLASKGASADDAQQFGPGGRLVVAQVAAELVLGRKLNARERRNTATPSDETWTATVVILRHRETAHRVAAMAVGS